MGIDREALKKRDEKIDQGVKFIGYVSGPMPSCKRQVLMSLEEVKILVSYLCFQAAW